MHHLHEGRQSVSQMPASESRVCQVLSQLPTSVLCLALALLSPGTSFASRSGRLCGLPGEAAKGSHFQRVLFEKHGGREKFAGKSRYAATMITLLNRSYSMS